MPSLTPVTTTHLGEHLPLLELLPDSDPLAWVRGGEGLVGWGVYATTTVSGPHRFTDARAWWQKKLESFAITNSVHGIGTGPVLFASFSFSPEDPSVLVIPQVVVGMKGSKSWITWVGSSPQPKLDSSGQPPIYNSVTWEHEENTDSMWKERVRTAINRIHSGALDKVVLARDFTGRSHSSIDARTVLKKLAAFSALASELIEPTNLLEVRRKTAFSATGFLPTRTFFRFV